MKILGIDPGYAIVGYGLVEYKNNRFTTLDYGVLTTPAHMKPEKRLSLLYDGMNSLVDMYSPDCMAIEELFFNTNITTAIQVAQARGVLLLAAEKHGIATFEYTPLQVKQAVTGYGRAEKNQVIAMVMSILGIKNKIKPDDAADALAIAVCHAHTGASPLSGYYNLK
nr:crossover junction endodeoxyribonuclease RuvC [Clostridia bacterium]